MTTPSQEKPRKKWREAKHSNRHNGMPNESYGNNRQGETSDLQPAQQRKPDAKPLTNLRTKHENVEIVNSSKSPLNVACLSSFRRFHLPFRQRSG
jgi:hypothetical protein